MSNRACARADHVMQLPVASKTLHFAPWLLRSRIFHAVAARAEHLRPPLPRAKNNMPLKTAHVKMVRYGCVCLRRDIKANTKRLNPAAIKCFVRCSFQLAARVGCSREPARPLASCSNIRWIVKLSKHNARVRSARQVAGKRLAVQP
jgi:hypothetical protein